MVVAHFLRAISDLIEPAFVEIDLKRGKGRLIFTRCEDTANRYDFNSLSQHFVRHNDEFATLISSLSRLF